MPTVTFEWPRGQQGNVFIAHRKARVDPKTGLTIPGIPAHVLSFKNGKATTSDAWEIECIKKSQLFISGEIFPAGQRPVAPKFDAQKAAAPKMLAVSGPALAAAIEKALSGPGLTEEQMEFGGLRL